MSGSTRIGTWLARPLASFHLIVTIATLLTVLGLVMVLSASSVESYADGGSAYALFTQQAMFAAIGAVLFYLALRVPIRVLRKLVVPRVRGHGGRAGTRAHPRHRREVSGGARRWFMLGPLSVQPSEIVKVTLVVWGAHLLASRVRQRANLKMILFPLVPAGAARLPARRAAAEPVAPRSRSASSWWRCCGSAACRCGCSSPSPSPAWWPRWCSPCPPGYRSDRMQAFFNPGDDPQGIGYQARQAMYSLADGGLFGRGLGQSRAKWSYLPNSHNDFIFAIIGEELGFLGCVAGLGLFALFVYTGLRIATPLGRPVPAAAHRDRDHLDHRRRR